MAIQARLYSENLAFPFINDDGGGDANPPQNLIETACGLNDLYLFNLHHHQQQYQQSQPPPGNQSSCFDNSFNKPISLPYSSSVTANIQKHNQEIEGLISLQNERLRLALQTHRKQQLLTILKNYESKSRLLLRQKDEEINRATNRRIELEEFLKRTKNERQKWQTTTNETEAIVIQLNNTIEELISDQNMKKDAEDEGSCCYENNENMKSKKMICKSCFNEDSCVVMLPCRHLCSCESCDVFLQSCPVCKMVKKASIQVSLFYSGL
ncbi:putative BOI-related E3 ubiquitin-protein ligase 3 [Bidens hawaiensis]|uniref:putative BOI-related E3 ubiquitin-protein ligase 3 n=1 Tax=Bidens hawaiensis TaxID=980011 RepID=UPI00404AC190